MGQLERYGLYVLVVVIFLILGVAIMGSDPAAPRENLAVIDDGGRGKSEMIGDSPSTRTKEFFNGRHEYTPDEVAAPGGGPRGASGRDLTRFRGTDPDAVDSPVVGSADPRRTDGKSDVKTDAKIDAKADPKAGPKPSPVSGATSRTHRVVNGDTMTSLAETFYGSQGKWKIIADANPSVDPNRMKLGADLVIPVIAVEASTPREAAPAPETPPTVVAKPRDPTPDATPAVSADGSRTHVVVKDDFLGRLARRYYGDANLWKLIADANPTIDPNRMPEGTILRIPPRR